MTTQTQIAGVDLSALQTWMDGQGLGSGELTNVTPIGGGTQNIMVRFTRDGREYVLRRGPEHLRPASNKAISREFQVLRALRGTGVPHPELIAPCDDPSVLGDAVFYLMEPIEGFNAGLELPDAAAGTPERRRELGFALVEALVSLHEIDFREVGLSDFGRPDGFLDRQVDRWLGELASYQELGGYPEVELPHVPEIAGWLRERVPTTWQPGLMHGDFHACNVMFRRDEPAVAAIVDWEMATIGDPLLDLGWLIATWNLDRAPEEFAGRLARAGGLPTADELAERYAQSSGRGLDGLPWYVVLASFKLGIILEGTYARARSNLAPPHIGDSLHTTAVELFDRAHSIVTTAS
jgi:aminoglycoside phosphotransferase (APT) family kinase protein